ncbi:hypothetical protein chiPu_0024919, partial [Chiloscyllium punctatum]|nr:hypothetical protein [Chiloscyllium punctatum]
MKSMRSVPLTRTQRLPSPGAATIGFRERCVGDLLGERSGENSQDADI